MRQRQDRSSWQHRRWQGVLFIVLILAIGRFCAAGPPVSPDKLDYSTASESNPLPKYMTEAEKNLPLPEPTRSDPPTGTVHCSAEYEYMEGLFIAWEGYTSILSQMAVGITTLDPQAKVFVVVDNASDQSSATSSLSDAGADMDQVEFIIRTTDTVWIRDYGPRYIYEDGIRTIIDHTYNRQRPNDNLLSDYISVLWSEPHYDIPLTHGGGNFHLFSNGDAFMTDLILTENTGLNEQDVIDLYADYQNVDLTIYPGFPTSFDSTQHIDMWMLPVGDSKIIIGEYEWSTGSPHTITEDAVYDLESSGYTVYRTPGWNSGGTHYTYTNAVIINDIVFVPSFGGSYTSQDAEALEVFEAAFPDYTLQQVNCASIIPAAGAMHCIVMHVPGESSTMLVKPGGDLEASGPVGGPFTPDNIVYTLENTTESPIAYEVTKTASWLTLTNASGSIPALDTVEVTVSINSDADTMGPGGYEDTVTFTNLADHEGDTSRHVSLLVGTPEMIYEFPLDSDPGWSMEGEWEFGQPTGEGGEHGGPDPTSSHTGSYVYGYDLSGTGNYHGDYEYLITEQDLTSLAIDCSDVLGVELRFRRWLGVEQPEYDHAYVRVSNNGSDWTTVWQNSATISDTAWTAQSFDISEVADGQPTVYLRWTMGITDSAWFYCGWNIDDIEIWAIPTMVDCNGNGIADDVDIAEGTSDDCNNNEIPDECDVAGGTSDDCNENDVPDECDIDEGTSQDCNENDVPDECDITGGTSTDVNDNGVPDECDIVPPLPEDSLNQTCTDDGECHGEAKCVSGVCYAPKHRYLSIARNPDQLPGTARRIGLVGGPILGWLGEPVLHTETGLILAEVVSAPVYVSEWPILVHACDCEIATGYSYVIQAIPSGQEISDEGRYSTPLELHTPSVWGDVVSTCMDHNCQPPDGDVDIDDILAGIAAFQSLNNNPLTWFDIAPALGDGVPNQMVDIDDILANIQGFQSKAYPGLGPLGCP